MLIYILVLDGVFDIGLASLTDVIGTARELAPLQDAPVQLDVRLVGVRRKVHTAQGLTVPVLLATDLPMPDVVLVPALGTKTPIPLAQAMLRRDVIEAGDWLKKWAKSGAAIGAACTGTFVLAETGLLDGQSATTSWWLSSLFRQRYPKVKLDESRMLVNSACFNSACFTTAGAALAHLDLGLGVVRSRSPALAALCARYLLIEPRASQAMFVIPDHVAHTDPIVERFEKWSRARLAQGFSMPDAARAIGASERTLGRRLQAVLGKSPLAYFQDLRVEQAVHLLQTSDDSVERIAALVGYSDGTTLRTLLRRKLGRGVKELRGRGASFAEK
ncbi:MAG: helix-turn-helix domain-containing protein [Pseudomonadota bacterium]